MAKRKAVSGSKGRKKKKVDEEDEWFATISTQEDIGTEVITKMYHIHDECQKKRHNIPCKDNPNCFEMLGQSEVGNKIKALPSTLGPNPNENMRKEGFPVGLKNLGATCYMNSLVQSLFMNTIFRQGIYDWNGTETEDKLLYQLKQLFAQLQYSESRYHDPVSFLQSTEMSSALQQDVQEFFKMIVTYIVDNAKAHVRKLVESQFMGKIAYNTKCKKCNTKSVKESEFFELELNVKGFKTIEDSLKNYIVEEEMTGQNQYFCSNCNSLQDGGRYISIRELPTVLSVQLLRFVYDMQTFTKKKVRDSISFPMVIDLRPFVEPKPSIPTPSTTNTAPLNPNTNTAPVPPTNNTTEEIKTETPNGVTENATALTPNDAQLPIPITNDSEPQARVTRSQTKQQHPPAPPTTTPAPSSGTSDTDEYIYELTSVMMHRGMTAYGGHYVVHVKDEHTGKWWQLNDEDVKPIEEAKVGVIDDSAYDSSAAATSTTSTTSTTATNSTTATTTTPTPTPTPTPTTTSTTTTTTTTDNAAAPIDVDALPESTTSTPPSPSKKKAKAKAKSAKSKAKGKGKGKTKDGEKDKDDEDSGEGEKGKDSQDKGRISSTMAYMLTYARRGRPILANTAPEKSISESICKQMETLKEEAQTYNTMFNHETDRLTARKLEFENIEPELSPTEGKPFNWISTEWLSSWLKAASDLTQIDNTKLICEHNKVDPSKIGEMKRISRAVWEHLNNGQYAGGPELTEDDYCKDCIIKICKDEKETTTNSKEKRTLLDELAESDTTEGYWISKNWFKEYSKIAPEDLSNDMTSDLLCPHNNLTTSAKARRLVPEKIWNQLRVYYGDGPAFHSSQTPCEECAQQDHETRELDDRKKKERQNELKALKELYTKVKTRASEPISAEPNFLISYPWCMKWKEWVDDPENDEGPGAIDNHNLICPDEKLLYDPISVEEELLPTDTAKMSIKPPQTDATNGNSGSTNGVTSSHTNGEKSEKENGESTSTSPSHPSAPESTTSKREMDPPPFLVIKQKLWEQVHDKYQGGPVIMCSTKMCTYEVCMDCIRSRKLQEEEDRINYTDGCLYVQQAPSGDGKEAPSMPKRSSSRYRLREKNPKRKLPNINSLTDTVQSLKLRIYQVLEVPPFQQALWFNDTLLENESLPLCSYRIPNGSDLTLQVVEGNPELLEENANKGQCEEGFKGSIFYSKSSKENSEATNGNTTDNNETNNETKENSTDNNETEKEKENDNENEKEKETKAKEEHKHEEKDMTNAQQPQLNGHPPLSPFLSSSPSSSPSRPPTDSDVDMKDVTSVYVSVPHV